MYEELIQRAKALDEKATPGPWMWDMRTAHHTCQLVTAHSGQYYVMQFSRWGMQDACPEFQQFKRYSGPVTERGGLGMVRADKMAKSYPGKEHHKGFDDYIDHPDAVFIAESRELVTELIEAVTTLRAENIRKDRVISRRVDDVSNLINKIEVWKHKYNSAISDLSRVEAERDAVISDLHSMHTLCMDIGRCCPECGNQIDELLDAACTFCKGSGVYCWKDEPDSENRCAAFEWRGAQGEG